MYREAPREDAESHHIVDQHKGNGKQQEYQDAEEERDAGDTGIQRLHQRAPVVQLIHQRRSLQRRANHIQTVGNHILGLEADFHGHGHGRGLEYGKEVLP